MKRFLFPRGNKKHFAAPPEYLAAGRPAGRPEPSGPSKWAKHQENTYVYKHLAPLWGNFWGPWGSLFGPLGLIFGPLGLIFEALGSLRGLRAHFGGAKIEKTSNETLFMCFWTSQKSKTKSNKTLYSVFWDLSKIEKSRMQRFLMCFWTSPKPKQKVK